MTTELSRYLRARAASDLAYANQIDGAIPPIEPPVDPPSPPPLPTEPFVVPDNGTLTDACRSAAEGQVIRIKGRVECVLPAVLGKENGVGAPNVTFEFEPGAKLIDAIPVDVKGAVLTVYTPGCKVLGFDADGRFVPQRKPFKSGVGAHNLVIAVREITHFAHHCVDVDGNSTLVTGSPDHVGIYENLWMDGDIRRDVHAVVTLSSNGLVVRGLKTWCNSGDAFQMDRGGRWNNVVFEDNECFDAPLSADMGGFKAGDYPGENVIDTKTTEHKYDESGNRLYRHLTIRNNRCYGYRLGFIGQPALFNIKEGVEADIYGNVIGIGKTDEPTASHIGVRAVGVRNRKFTKIYLHDNIFRGCKVAIRGEDNLQEFVCERNIFTDCDVYFDKATGTEVWPFTGWSVRENLIIDASAVGKTWPVTSGDRRVIGIDDLAFPIYPVSWVDGVLTRNDTNKIVAE